MYRESYYRKWPMSEIRVKFVRKRETDPYEKKSALPVSPILPY